jgi:hypothetical protein
LAVESGVVNLAAPRQWFKFTIPKGRTGAIGFGRQVCLSNRRPAARPGATQPAVLMQGGRSVTRFYAQS